MNICPHCAHPIDLGANRGTTLRFEDIAMTLRTQGGVRTYEVTCAGERVHLTPTQAAVLELLIRNAPAPVSRVTFETAIWGDADDLQSDSLRTNITRLRRVLEKPFARRLIHNQYGIGYFLATTPPAKAQLPIPS